MNGKELTEAEFIEVVGKEMRYTLDKIARFKSLKVPRMHRKFLKEALQEAKEELEMAVSSFNNYKIKRKIGIELGYGQNEMGIPFFYEKREWREPKHSNHKTEVI